MDCDSGTRKFAPDPNDNSACASLTNPTDKDISVVITVADANKMPVMNCAAAPGAGAVCNPTPVVLSIAEDAKDGANVGTNALKAWDGEAAGDPTQWHVVFFFVCRRHNRF